MLNCSARIWPSANRNGSFQELNNRKHRSVHSNSAMGVRVCLICQAATETYFDSLNFITYLE